MHLFVIFGVSIAPKKEAAAAAAGGGGGGAAAVICQAPTAVHVKSSKYKWLDNLSAQKRGWY